jgi:hypothetical protein
MTEQKRLGDVVEEMYKGKVIQIYCGDSGATNYYADCDVVKKVFIEGKVKWANGEVICLESHCYNNSNVCAEVLVNTWSTMIVMEKKENSSILNFIYGGHK